MSGKSESTAFMEPHELRDHLQSGKDVVIIDVRSAEEFSAGHVEGAVNVPSEKLAEHASRLPADATIVTVCNFGGARSCNAAEQLRGLGYRNALPLRGGARGWSGDS